MSTAFRTLAARIVMLVLVALPALPAQAAEEVRARGWSNETYGRIIFDWPKRVKYDAQIDGATLNVAFARPMETDLGRVLKYLGGYVSGARLSEDGKTATFELAGLFDLDTFTSGNSVVVDLRRTQAASEPPRDTRMAPLRVRVGHHPGFTRLVFDWLDPVDYAVSRDGQHVRMRFEHAGTIDVAALDAALPKPDFETPSSRMDGRELVLDLTVPAQSYIRHFRDDAKIVLDVMREGAGFGGMVATEYTAGGALPPPGNGPMIQTISPSGEVIAVPAMVGTTVAVVPEENRVPLVTEETPEAPPQPVPIQGSYTPLTHYDPNASGLPRDLLLYDRSFVPRAPAASPVTPVSPGGPALPDS